MKIELTLDYVGEYGTIDKAVIDAVAVKLRHEFDKQIRETIETQLKASIVAVTDRMLTDAIHPMLETEYQPVDEYGDPVGKPLNIRDRVKDRASKWLSEKVDRDGKATNYHSSDTRIQWLAEKVVKDVVTFEVQKEMKSAAEAAKKAMKDRLSEMIAEVLVKK